MSESPTDSILVFYVCIFEAPERPPDEIARATLTFETHGVICESRLLRPPAAWTPELVRVTGLRADPSDLREFGTPARVLAAHMNETLAKCEFSATLADDARIRRIFDAAKMEPEFALPKSGADELIAEPARLRRNPPSALARPKRRAEVVCLTGVRADARARYLATYCRFVAGRN